MSCITLRSLGSIVVRAELGHACLRYPERLQLQLPGWIRGTPPRCIITRTVFDGR
jgi:hypothetical protein